MSKPSEFYVGVLDFFAILLPGAIATAILQPKYGDLIIGPLINLPGDEAGPWAVFLVFAYFLGHLIFSLGSLMDPYYEKIRKKFYPDESGDAYPCATQIHDTMLQGNEIKALNTFQWARSVLISACPAAAEDVLRLEADSKFFRSLFVVFALAAILFFISGQSGAGWGALGLAILCTFRYFDRRRKSNAQACIHIVALHRIGKLQAPAEKG